MNFVYLKKIIFTATIFLAVPFFTNAQVVNMEYSPESPKGGQLVTVSLQAFNLDLNNSEISWYQGDKFIKKGTGIKNFSFTAVEGDNIIKASVKSGNKLTNRTILINTSDLDLLWEVSDSYEPPFYKGKVLPIRSSLIKVVAIPQIKDSKGHIVSPDSLVYSWQKDGSNFAGQSGYGGSSFSYPMGILDSQNTVSVKTSGSTKQASSQTNIKIYSPEIHFYEYDIAYGPLYNKAIKEGQSFKRSRINIIAEPFFAFTKNLDNPDLTLSWRVSGGPIKTDQKNIVLLNFGNNIGNLDINLQVDNQRQLLQGISKSLRLNILANE